MIPDRPATRVAPRWVVTSLTWMWLLVVAIGFGLVIADKLPHGWPGGCSTGMDGNPLAACFGLIMCCSAVVTLVTLTVLERTSRSSIRAGIRPPAATRRRGPARWQASVVPVLATVLALSGLWMSFVAQTDFLVTCRPA